MPLILCLSLTGLFLAGLHQALGQNLKFEAKKLKASGYFHHRDKFLQNAITLVKDIIDRKCHLGLHKKATSFGGRVLRNQ